MAVENEEQIGSNMDQEGALAALQGMGIDTSEIISEAPTAQTEESQEEPNPLLRESNSENTEGNTEGVADGEEQEGEDVSTEASESESEEGVSGEDETSIDNPLFSGPLNSSETTDEIEIKDLESLNPILKKFGIEDVKELPGKLESYIESEKRLAAATSDVERATTVFQNMPAELYKAINDHFNGGNWRESLGVQGLDYDSNTKDLNPKSLVDTFSPGELTPEDWEEYNDEEGDPAIKRLVGRVIKEAESKFELKKSSVQSFRDDQIKQQVAIQEKFSESLGEATKTLKEKYPSMTQADIQSLQNLANRDALISALYNEDGSIKPDGLTKIALMTHGEDLVDKLMKAAKNKIARDTETKLNEERLLRSSDVPNVATNSSKRNDVVSPEVQKQIDEAERLVKHVN